MNLSLYLFFLFLFSLLCGIHCLPLLFLSIFPPLFHSSISSLPTSPSISIFLLHPHSFSLPLSSPSSPLSLPPSLLYPQSCSSYASLHSLSVRRLLWGWATDRWRLHCRLSWELFLLCPLRMVTTVCSSLTWPMRFLCLPFLDYCSPLNAWLSLFLLYLLDWFQSGSSL